ncbi:hypothetical protein [uncultured Thiodictyon sp.]|uniref:hypothetical protein n=1 Tax=uncultured Thiodictyon sp. TaxID=1846217 RepID=UPI0025E94AB7|nr:hypothetical protein [uncultured Thiodictyon sp.]
MVSRIAASSARVDQDRRRLLQALGATPALFLPAGLVEASAMDVTRLHPTRFVGGLILDFAAAVLVNLASGYVADQLRAGSVAAGRVTLATAVPQNEGGAGAFDHVGYKVSVVRLGVVDYQANQRRLLALLLKEPGQEARFAALRDYLRDERIRVKLADGDYSQLLGADLTPDDLFTLDYLDVPAERLPAHYRNLIQASGARVFDTWYG